jgi:prepilin-type N-terminal cleavage/methylation domain-containing protein/prepilin-type processing-associated H-X9-DG protein
MASLRRLARPCPYLRNRANSGIAQALRSATIFSLVKGEKRLGLVERGFTLVELLTVISVIAILASLLLPALAGVRNRSHQISCLNNLKQLNLGMMVYCSDSDDKLPYNLGATEIKQILSKGLRYNWANSVLNWERDSDNTNVVLNTEASLGPYVGKSARIFRCPSDHAVSAIQRAVGWTGRSRSISMNAMVGDAGAFMTGDENKNNVGYHQYRKASEFDSAADTFVFIEEHPDSINDGYFLNRAVKIEWNDLPASWHNGAANLSFGDGHCESHLWLNALTQKPNRPDGANLPIVLAESQRSDFYWLLKRTTRIDSY